MNKNAVELVQNKKFNRLFLVPKSNNKWRPTGGDSDSRGTAISLVSIVPHLKLISMFILKEPYGIEKCAPCLDTFLRF